VTAQACRQAAQQSRPAFCATVDLVFTTLSLLLTFHQDVSSKNSKQQGSGKEGAELPLSRMVAVGEGIDVAALGFGETELQRPIRLRPHRRRHEAGRIASKRQRRLARRRGSAGGG
jgi:hypothetical protein